VDFNLDKIMVAHYKAKTPLLLWGPSGFGKTSYINSFGQRKGLAVKILHAQYLDPLSIFIPDTKNMKADGSFKMYPAAFLKEIFDAKKPTILFLDELTRAREDTFNILTEMLLDREIFGHKIPPCVLMIGASNFAEEDTGVKELPDAVIQRLTHIYYAPTQEQTLNGFQSPKAKTFFTRFPGQIPKLDPDFVPPIFDRIKRNPRNLETIIKLMEANNLKGNDLLAVCRGRLGYREGTDLYYLLTSDSLDLDFPENFTMANLDTFVKIEKSGDISFILNLMKNPICHKEAAATYLVYYASPTVAQAAKNINFDFRFKEAPINPSTKNPGIQYTRPDGSKAEFAGMGLSWTVYCALLGKVTL
jgi:hypothetical protein